MQVHEYLQQLEDQIRCKKAKEWISEEMKGHIEDQAGVYQEFGIEESAAYERAVEQMGDPVEVGTALDRIHRPRFDWKMVCAVFIFSIGGYILQSAFISKGEVYSPSGFLFYGIGFLVMIGVMLLDYSILGKYPIPIWIGVNLLIFILNITVLFPFSRYPDSGNLTLSNGILILSFAGVVYHFRNRKYKGILSCLLYLALGCFLMQMSNQRITPIFTLFFVGIFILSFAVHKGWYEVKKWKAQMLIWASWILPLGLLGSLLFSGLIGQTFQADRIRKFLLSAQEDAGGINYNTDYFRNLMKSLNWVGGNEGWEVHSWDSIGIGYEFGGLMNQCGIIPAIIIFTLIALLLGYMGAKLLKQQNRLGMLLGIGGAGTLGFSVVLNLLVSLTLIPPTSSFVPFLTPDGMGTLVLYLFLGIYLSIYRHETIVRESNAKPGWKIRIEKTK